MSTLLKRNIMLFFKDKAAVFFSLMAVLIIIALYALFLGDTILENFDGMKGGEFFVNSWVMAGILAVISLTSTLGAYGIMIDDKSKKISKDLYVTPLKRAKIAGGYVLSACTIGVILSFITLAVAEIYISARGGTWLTANEMFSVICLILLCVACGSSITLFLASLIKSANAFAALSTVVGTLAGFLTGVYIPIGELPEAVQTVIKVFPTSHGASLLRQVLTQTPGEELFLNAPQSIVNQVNQNMGIVFEFNSKTISPEQSIIYLLITTMVFFMLSIGVMSRKNR